MRTNPSTFKKTGQVRSVGTFFSEHRIRWVFRGLALITAAVQTFAVRNAINSDGRSYLEVARAFLRHDWKMAANSYWGPLYSWILMPFLGWINPSLRHEFPLAHLINFALFLVCAVAFEFFWTRLLAYRTLKTDASIHPRLLSDKVLWILGYTSFISLMSDLLAFVNPDLTLAILVFFVSGVMLQIISTAEVPTRLFVWLGILFGVGYLAKAVMFPMGFVFLAMLAGSKSRNLARVGLTLMIFLSISAPEIIWLSISKGYPTFSGTGKLAYAWYTYDLPILHWQGQPPGSGIPVHPTRKIYSHPDVYEFNGPIRSAYPPWYDPSYWNEGMSPHFQFSRVANHFVTTFISSLWMVCVPRAFILGIAVLFLLADPIATLKNAVHYWPLWIITAAIFAAYSITLAIPRYYAPWQLLLWGPLICSIQLRHRFIPTRVCLWIAVGAAVLMFASQARWINWQLHHAREDDGTPDYGTAEGLQKIGLTSGDRVAAIGFDEVAQWAYLGRFFIVAEVTSWNACEFWQSPPAIQAEVLGKFRQSGASAVVANTGGGMMIRTRSGAPPIDQRACARPDVGWRKIEGSANYAYLLN